MRPDWFRTRVQEKVFHFGKYSSFVVLNKLNKTGESVSFRGAAGLFSLDRPRLTVVFALS